MPVAKLEQEMSWPELLHWIAFYTWESDQELPPGERPIRARTPQEGADAINRLFKISPNVAPKEKKNPGAIRRRKD